MTVEQTTTITVDELSAVVLECKSCGGALQLSRTVIRQDHKTNDLGYTDHAQRVCPACGTEWWSPDRSPNLPEFLKRLFTALNMDPQYKSVAVKFLVNDRNSS